MRYQPEAFGGWSRERFIEALAAEGIPASRGYIPLYRTGAVRDTERTLRQALGLAATTLPHCPVTERAAGTRRIYRLNPVALVV